MPLALTVTPLAEVPELIPLLAKWFVAEWPAWYGPGGPGSVELDLKAFAASERSLPIGMVVFEGQVPVGAGALKAQSIPSHSHLSPWAAAGYVLPSCRGRGVGAVLLKGLVSKAHALGYQYVYCGTSTSQSLLARSGWQPLETTSLEGQLLTVFRSAA